MSDPKQILSTDQISEAALTGWHQINGTIQATFNTGDFLTGLQLVNLIGDSAETANHHPDIALTYPTVSLTLTSHDVGGLTVRDVELARKVNEHAAGLGVKADDS